MTTAATPRVFISHGSEDKDRFVLGFATQLLARGIDAWVDKWEIALGDCLVQRIFSIGIAGADAFRRRSDQRRLHAGHVLRRQLAVRRLCLTLVSDIDGAFAAARDGSVVKPAHFQAERSATT